MQIWAFLSFHFARDYVKSDIIAPLSGVKWKIIERNQKSKQEKPREKFIRKCDLMAKASKAIIISKKWKFNLLKPRKGIRKSRNWIKNTENTGKVGKWTASPLINLVNYPRISRLLLSFRNPIAERKTENKKNLSMNLKFATKKSIYRVVIFAFLKVFWTSKNSLSRVWKIIKFKC